VTDQQESDALRRVRVLVLDEEFPYPTNNGKRTRSFNLYSRLATQFHIRYIGYGTEESEAAAALKGAGIEPVAVRPSVPAKQGALFYLRLLANLCSSLPYVVTSHDSWAYRNAVRHNVARFKPDLLLCEWTPYAVHARGLSSTKKLLSTHNIEADIWRRYFDNESNPLRRWYIGKQWRKIERFERTALTWVDGALAVSQHDRARLDHMRPGLRTTVVSNGVDLDYFRPTTQPAQRGRLVFTGSMDWRPNQDALRYFVHDILPLLRKAQGDLECSFVGRSPPADIQAMTNIPGVRVTGTVNDVRQYVEQAAVYIVPLRVGGGSRLKILEAMAMGRAIVSTTVGAEGLDFGRDNPVLLADHPTDFANAVLKLLGDPELCTRLGAVGRRIVEERFGWEQLAEQCGHFIRATLQSRETPSPERGT
jgi:glycosyltransferase involved in cell wall biosynthesis